MSVGLPKGVPRGPGTGEGKEVIREVSDQDLAVLTGFERSSYLKNGMMGQILQ
jgi:hypothetical protein